MDAACLPRQTHSREKRHVSQNGKCVATVGTWGSQAPPGSPNISLAELAYATDYLLLWPKLRHRITIRYILLRYRNTDFFF